jgi:ribosomally synthesized peptide (two-chain TOMM family)
MSVPASAFSNNSSYDLHQWRTVWIKAVAKAWVDEAFCERMMTDFKAAIRKEFDYQFPVEIDITCIPDPSARWDAGSSSPWTRLSDIKIVLHLPPKPADEKDHGIAIANYHEQLTSRLGIVGFGGGC